MSWRTNVCVVKVRGVTRFLGLNKLIARMLYGKEYEKHFDAQFSSRLREGECVWDVGANIGHYTLNFAKKVGVEGLVVAFEPSQKNYDALRENTFGQGNIKLVRSALGDVKANVNFLQGDDDIGATSRIIEGGSLSETVPSIRGEELIASGEVESPNAIKIDVEGYEPEVLAGLGPYLMNKKLHTLGIEVHFGLLAERGLENASAEVEKLLEGAGYQISWVDSSHMIAVKD